MIQARSVRLAAVIVLGGAVALATSACGGPMQAGAAAVVDGQRTTDKTIQDQVASIVTLDQRFNVTQAAATDADRAGYAQTQLSLLVQQALWQRAADDTGVSVTAADDAKVGSTLVEEARSSLGKGFPGSDDEAVAVAVANPQNSSPLSLAPSNVALFSHIQALYLAVINGMAKKLNVDPNDQNGSQALGAALNPVMAKAAKEIDYKISPRYGTFDAASDKFVTGQDSWLRPTKQQLADAAAAQAQQTQ
jgi:hypothetical protein